LERLPEMNPGRSIKYLSAPAEVSMADRWFEIAAMDHFWIRRRFAVFRELAGSLMDDAREIAEIGCGHGLLQLQIEEAYGRDVAGFDLNEVALKQNVSRHSAVHCYDIFQKEPSLHRKFELIFLFDVLEHINDEDNFLKALLFHLAPGGSLIVNVPAGMWAFAKYDVAAGHVRRYSMDSLENVATRNNLEFTKCTYWGLPLVPTLMLRKLWLLGKSDKDTIIAAGFGARNTLLNQLLGFISKCEPIPQKILGTSLMAVLRVCRNDG
jgi:SAM-dependent methyltransferase